MNAPNPAPKPRPIALKPKWIATLVMLLVVYLLLRPWLVERFGLDLPGFTDVKPKAEATSPDQTAGTPSKTAQQKKDKNRPVEVPVIPEQGEPVIEEEATASAEPPGKNDPAVDPKSDPSVTPQTTVARSDKSSTPKSANPPKMGNTPSGTKTTSPNPPKSNSNPGVAKGGSPATTNPRAPETSKTTPKPAKPNTGRPAPTTPAAEPEKPKLGVLKPAGRDRFESTAGLVYSQYRIDHVMEHARDIPDKPTHGVFEGSRDEILALIDEAYQLSQKRGPPQVVIEDEGDRTTYTVNLNRKIGHGGGQSGARRRNPPLKMVKIVLEGDEVITAFPTDR